MSRKSNSDTPTAVHTISTSKLPVYKTTAREFADKLDQIPEEHAARLAVVLREFAAEFEAWETDPNTRPPPDERRTRIDAYLTEYQRALALFSR